MDTCVVIGPLRREFIQNFFLIFFKKRNSFQDASTGDTLPIDLLNEWNSFDPPSHHQGYNEKI
jgi:hypothetical protein